MIYQGPPGLILPEMFGPIGAGADAAAIAAAIAAVQEIGGGQVWLSQRYTLEAPVTVPPGPAVDFRFIGAMNRAVSPPVFGGGLILPSNTFPANTPLLTLGAAGQPATNPAGSTLWRPKLSGRAPNGTLITGCTGLQINDTADVHLVEPGLANFDRTGGTGTAVSVAGTGANNAVGFQCYGGIISTSWRGILIDGAGATDWRIIGTLMHSCTQQVTAGPSGGSGGGGQMTGCHLVFAGAAAGAWQLSIGSGAGDYTIVGNYFDQNGASPPILLSNAKGIISDNHFLCDPTCNGALITLSTASQEMCLRGNQANGNGSGVTALFKLTGGAGGAPTAGVYDGNLVYGTAASLIAPLIDKNNTAIPATSTATTYVQGNVAGA